MKVLHIITRLDKGGSAEAVVELCEALFKGYKSINDYMPVLVYGGDVSYEFKFRSHHIKELVRNISIIKDFLAFVKLLKIIKKEKPEIINTHSSKAGIIGRWAARFIGFKNIIHTPHGHVFYGYFNPVISFIFRVLEIITSKITKKFIALTEGEMIESIRFGIGRTQQWEIIPSPVDIRNINQEIKQKIVEKYKSYFIIGTVARLELVKGVKYFIESIPFVLKEFKNIIFLIVGDGSQRKTLQKRAKELGIENSVSFIGMTDYVPEYISIMDIYVQPSLNEGMGQTIVQAGMLGKPIVATYVQGIPSVIKHSYSGLLVPPRNPFEISSAILCLLKNPSLRERLASNAKASMSELVDGLPKYSLGRVLKNIIRIYDKTLSKCLT